MAVMPPMITRKKEVRQKFDPDTFRIFGEVADIRRERLLQQPREGVSNKYHKMPDIFATSVTLPSEIATYGLRNAEIDFRKHRPHPTGCNFLRENARLINEPICSVQTFTPGNRPRHNNVARDHHWWPNYSGTPSVTKPKFTLDTTVRLDFRYDKKSAPAKSTRHSANTGFNRALGIVPVNTLAERDGSQRFFKERMSYEHAYDSRTLNNYPIRSKRHGSYVYEGMTKADAQRYLSHPGYKAMKPGWAPPLEFESKPSSAKVASNVDNRNTEGNN